MQQNGRPSVRLLEGSRRVSACLGPLCVRSNSCKGPASPLSFSPNFGVAETLPHGSMLVSSQVKMIYISYYLQHRTCTGPKCRRAPNRRFASKASAWRALRRSNPIHLPKKIPIVETNSSIGYGQPLRTSLFFQQK